MSTGSEKKSVPQLGRKSHTRFDNTRKRRFIAKLEKDGIISKAAASVGISRITVYKAMEKDETFKQRVEIAKERADARLEEEFQRRIYEGNEKVEYDGEGNVMRKTVTHDNALLTKALESHFPERYGKKTESNVNVKVSVEDSAISKLANFLNVELPEDEKEINPEIEGDYWEEDD